MANEDSKKKEPAYLIACYTVKEVPTNIKPQ